MTDLSPIVVIFDTETTGIEVEEHRLVEIAGVHLDKSFPQFETLVNPERSIPAEARGIHHISPSDVENAPSEKEAVSLFTSHFQSGTSAPLVLAAHNVKFDRGYIERINPALNPFYICTYKCSVVVWPDAPDHKNQTLRYYLGLEFDEGEIPPTLFPHRALYDAIVTRGILLELLKHKSLRELVQISNNPILLNKVSFGKHKGKLWSEVDYGYLRWCVGQSDMNEDVLHTAHYYLNANSKFSGKGRR